jgi:hypothetical protein
LRVGTGAHTGTTDQPADVCPVLEAGCRVTAGTPYEVAPVDWMVQE